ncbi:MAG TPA: hypothetical protein VN767_23380 [Streptosporangiaceae bacterium]|jgi:hypothetical protein|nr:hypothetical protein [Streptosporangiaceae bacterium]
MEPNTGPVNDDQAQSPDLTDVTWPPPPGGPVAVAPPTDGGSRHWRSLIAGVVACGVVASVAWAAWQAGTDTKVGSTRDLRLITPAPQTAGGLAQDRAIETEPGYQDRVDGVRQFYASTFHLPPEGSDVAIYLGQMGDGPVNNSDLVIYLGFNLRERDNTLSVIQGALKGLGSQLINSMDVRVRGGPGDTSYDCVTGLGSAGIGTTGQFTACGWATDRTLAIFLRVAPDPRARTLISVMKKMRPDLIRGLSVPPL